MLEQRTEEAARVLRSHGLRVVALPSMGMLHVRVDPLRFLPVTTEFVENSGVEAVRDVMRIAAAEAQLNGE